MDNIVNLLLNGNTEFTPEFLIRAFVLLIVIDMIISICKSLISVNKE